MDWKILFTDINFIIIQIVGALAWLFLYLSYHRKTTNKILIFQIIANILFIIHYFCLGAYTGLAICFVEIIFDYLYYKTNDDKLLFKVKKLEEKMKKLIKKMEESSIAFTIFT